MSNLRIRLAVHVAVVSLAVLAVAGMAMVSVVSGRMHDSVREQAIGAVRQAQASIQAGTAANEVAAPRPGEPTLQIGLDDAPAGADPADGGDLGVLAETVARLESGDVTVMRRDLNGVAVYLAAGTALGPQGQRYTVVAAAPLTETERTLSTLRTATIAIVPILTIVLALLAAASATRVLRPVVLMRAEAETISHGTLHRRLTPSTRSTELAALAATMNDMLDRLERAVTGQRQFVSDVSHELRSPLATIRGTIETGMFEPSTLVESGPAAIGEIDRLDDLIDDLLALAHLDEAERIQPEELDLDEVVASHVAALGHSTVTINTRNVHHARLLANRRAIDGLVRNLLDNALRHARREVNVSVTAAEQYVTLVVDDDGVGVPAADRERIFDRFARLDEGRARDRGGAGLGLAVVAAAARAHGGIVGVADAPSGGARFEVRLPCSPPSRSVRERDNGVLRGVGEPGTRRRVAPAPEIGTEEGRRHREAASRTSAPPSSSTRSSRPPRPRPQHDDSAGPLGQRREVEPHPGSDAAVHT
jgi:signal transduction histidine kinase